MGISLSNLDRSLKEIKQSLLESEQEPKLALQAKLVEVLLESGFKFEVEEEVLLDGIGKKSLDMLFEMEADRFEQWTKKILLLEQEKSQQTNLTFVVRCIELLLSKIELTKAEKQKLIQHLEEKK